MDEEFELQANALIEAARFIYAKGSAPATSGNFSARLSDGNIAITVSGKHKGALIFDDIMKIDAQGNSLDGKKPSAETLLHTALYARYPNVNSILHPHSVHATLMAKLFGDALILEDYELLKALEGIQTHETRVVIPIFANDQNIQRLSQKVDDYLDEFGDIFAYIIAGHGFYTWGSSIQDAIRHVEALEFLFDAEIRLLGVKK